MGNDYLKNYDYVEGTEFEGLMPAVMETLGDDYVTGKSDEIVAMHGFKALGSDALEVIDIEAFYDGGSEGEGGGNNGGDNGDQGGDNGDQGGDNGDQGDQGADNGDQGGNDGDQGAQGVQG
jgi:hypothetical protein